MEQKSAEYYAYLLWLKRQEFEQELLEIVSTSFPINQIDEIIKFQTHPIDTLIIINTFSIRVSRRSSTHQMRQQK